MDQIESRARTSTDEIEKITHTRSGGEERIRQILLYRLPGWGLTVLSDLYKPIGYDESTPNPDSPPYRASQQSPVYPPSYQTDAESSIDTDELIRRLQVVANASNSSLTMISPLPKCTGTEPAADWLNAFEAGMLDRNVENDDTKMAKYWKTCIVADSAAAAWYDTLTPGQKGSFEQMEASYRGIFEVVRAKSDSEYLQELRRLRLEDEDLGGKDSSGAYKHEVFAREVVTLASRIPTAAMSDALKASTILDGVGPELKKFIRMTVGKAGSVREVVECVRNLGDTDIELIKEPYRWRKALDELRRADQQRARAFGTNINPGQENRQPTFGQVQDQRLQDGGSQIAIGPFASTQDGNRAYQEAIRAWYNRHGQDATASLSRPFPLSPGTVRPGSGECFRCGMTGHVRPQCSSSRELPENEQRYRGQVMSEARRRNGAGGPRPSYGSGANAVAPIRGLMMERDYGQRISQNPSGLDGPAWDAPFCEEAGNEPGFDL